MPAERYGQAQETICPETAAKSCYTPAPKPAARSSTGLKGEASALCPESLPETTQAGRCSGRMKGTTAIGQKSHTSSQKEFTLHARQTFVCMKSLPGLPYKVRQSCMSL